MATASAELQLALSECGYCVSGPGRRGASATVFPARAAGRGVVAVKVFEPDVDGRLPAAEASALSTTDHPGIASFIDAGRLRSGHRYLVSDWVSGSTLAERMSAQGLLCPAVTTTVVGQLADVLDHVHGCGIVHRDLSPANLMLDGDRLTLIDFGIARSDDRTATDGADLIGTTRYLAPELIQGAPPSAASDQYAAAVITYEMLTGAWPYEESASVANVLHLHLHHDPVPLTERRPDTALHHMEAALIRALAKEPDERFASMGEFFQAFTGQGPAGERRRYGLLRRRTRVGALVAAGALGVAALGVGLVGTGSDTDPDPDGDALAGVGVGTAPSTTATDPVGPGPLAISSDWEAGAAVESPCNLIEAWPGFEGGVVPSNFYLDPNNPDLDNQVRLLTGAGEDGTTALALGDDVTYGQFGHIIGVEPGRRYTLAASVAGEGDWLSTEIGVEWLGADFQRLDDDWVMEPALRPDGSGGRVSMTTPPAPPDAAYAVTRLYKNAASGTMLVDELVFSEGDAVCGPEGP